MNTIILILLTRKTKLEKLSVTDLVNGQCIEWLCPKKDSGGKAKEGGRNTNPTQVSKAKEDRKIEILNKL